MEIHEIICAIAQETKFFDDGDQGHYQYRNGYIKALQTVEQFLAAALTTEKRPTSCDAVERLFFFSQVSRLLDLTP
jgi:hypothetical protein